MIYYIMQKSENGITSFLANKNTYGRYWTTELIYARIFRNLDNAKLALSKLKYNNPKIFDAKTANIIDNELEKEHPFSMSGTEFSGAR